ncbi:MAG: SHOCT domain-containing protein [Nitrospinae bacterium]|nr:SHOCT domain-containing protein [Nitrospinota bacterium]
MPCSALTRRSRPGKWTALPIYAVLCLFVLIPGRAQAIEPSGQAPPYQVKLVPFHVSETEKYALEILHPYSFDPETVRAGMASIAYQTKALAWSKKKRVFTSAMIKALGPLVVDLFAKATSKQKVAFQLKNKSGKTLLAGDAFFTPEGLNWRFTQLEGETREVDDFSVMGETWRLVPLNDQAYKTKTPYENLTVDITNWIVLKNVKPDPARTIKSPRLEEMTDMGAKPGAEGDIKKRLRLLEELKRDGLIRDDEYEMKRREILKLL